MQRPVLLLAILLSACQLRPTDTSSPARAARLLPVPPLTVRALGETLVLDAQVAQWKPGEVADVLLSGQTVGQVSADGHLKGSTAPVSTAQLRDPVAELLARTGETCTQNTVKISDAGARVAKFYGFNLRRAATGQGPADELLMVTSPAMTPGINRGEWHQISGTTANAYGGEGTSLALVYADRDVTVRGQRDCHGSLPDAEWNWQESSAVNLELKKGWNEVEIKSASRDRRSVGWSGKMSATFSELDLTVQGVEPVNSLPWTRNADPLY